MTFFFKRKQHFKIAILGAGKLAFHLAPALEAAGHQIVSVYSRRPRQAENLCENLYEAEAVHSLNFSSSPAEVFILALADDAIGEVASALRLPGQAILLHTSGGKPIDVLKVSDAAESAVLYPLQTFSPDKVINFRQLPFLIEANSPVALKKVRQIAESLSDRVEEVDSYKRRLLHTAAVFACNFSNHMLHLAEEMVEQEGLEFDLLKPLIEETFTKALHISPSKSQTGPAIRGDDSTMQGHMALLREKDPALAEIYQMLSLSIRRYHET